MNTKSLVENLKDSDKNVKLQSMAELIAIGDSVIDIVIAELPKVEDTAIYWALEGIDYSEEDATKHIDPSFKLLEDTVGLRKWYVLAYAKILISFGKLSSDRLLPLFDNDQTALNAMIAFILGAIGDKRSIPILLNRLKLSAIPEKIRVIQALGRLKSEVAIQYLHPLLPIDELTFEVAVALGRIADAKSVDPLVKQFRRDLTTAHVTGAALVKLGEVAVEPLIEVIADPEAVQVHALAAETIGMLGDERAASSLINLVEQTSNDVTRYQTIIALGKLRVSRAFPLLEKFMLYPVGINDRYRAVEALASIDYDRAFNVFTRVSSDKLLDTELRCHALCGFRLLGTLHDIQPLLDAVSDPDISIRSTAVTQLAILQDERARITLEGMVDDPDWRTRVWAVDGLERLDARLNDS
ncbi:MAG: hypothetical protein GC179_07430 [Anaerolineaceae bacterium]|nr:hypothetical protein [Anaerolineaceae bacterium]